MYVLRDKLKIRCASSITSSYLYISYLYANWVTTLSYLSLNFVLIGSQVRKRDEEGNRLIITPFKVSNEEWNDPRTIARLVGIFSINNTKDECHWYFPSESRRMGQLQGFCWIGINVRALKLKRKRSSRCWNIPLFWRVMYY